MSPSPSVVVSLAAAVLLSQLGPAKAGDDTTGPSEETLQQLYRYCVEPTTLELERCQEVIRKTERLLERTPNSPPLYLALADAYWNRSYMGVQSLQEGLPFRTKAIELCHEALRLDPDDIQALRTCGGFTGDNREHLRYARRIVELDPMDAEAHRVIAKILISEGKYEEAIPEYRKYLEVSPYGGREGGGDEIGFAAGELLLELGKTEEAVKQYLLHLEVGRYRAVEDGFDHMLFAKSVTKAGQINGAVKILEAFLRREPERVSRCRVLAPLDLAPYAAYPALVKEIERALPYCTKLEHRNKAVALMREGKPEEAIHELELQLKENPRYSGTYYLLRDLYQKQGKTDKAEEIMVRYLKLEDDSVVRCRAFRQLNPYRYVQVDRQLVERLQNECQPKRRESGG